MRVFWTCLAAALLAGRASADDKVDEARAAVLTLTRSAKTFYLKHERYPASLKKLENSKYVTAPLPLDPWVNPYKYDAKGPRNGGKMPDIWAESPNKKEIGNWSEPKEKKDGQESRDAGSRIPLDPQVAAEPPAPPAGVGEK
jgi:hypothetical protein